VKVRNSAKNEVDAGIEVLGVTIWGKGSGLRVCAEAAGIERMKLAGGTLITKWAARQGEGGDLGMGMGVPCN